MQYDQNQSQKNSTFLVPDLMKKVHLFLLDSGEESCSLLVGELQKIPQATVTVVSSLEDLQRETTSRECDLVLWNPESRNTNVRQTLQEIRASYSQASYIQLSRQFVAQDILLALRDGILDCLPLDPLKEAVERIEKVHIPDLLSRKREKAVAAFTTRMDLEMELPTNLDWIGPMANRITYELRSLNLIAPSQYYNLYLAFYESLSNALEHGNLGITYEEKTRLLGENRYLERLRELCSTPPFSDKKLRIRCRVDQEWTVLSVEDEGSGFTVHKDDTFDSFLNTDSHGRGLFLIRQVVDRVTFNEKGNVIHLHIRRPERVGGED